MLGLLTGQALARIGSSLELPKGEAARRACEQSRDLLGEVRVRAGGDGDGGRCCCCAGVGDAVGGLGEGLGGAVGEGWGGG